MDPDTREFTLLNGQKGFTTERGDVYLLDPEGKYYLAYSFEQSCTPVVVWVPPEEVAE